MTAGRFFLSLTLSALTLTLGAAEPSYAGGESATAVRNEIVQGIERDPSIGSHAIEIETRGGRVRLSGDVSSQRDRERIIAIAESVPGVGRVQDDLSVRDVTAAVTQVDDITLARQIQARLDELQTPQRFQVQVATVDGQAVVSGSVDTPETRTAVERTIRSTPGVVAVVNNIRIQESDDAAVAQRVRAAIEAARDISIDRLTVDSQDGVITLRGVGRSHLDVDSALALALNVEGVRSVESEIRTAREYRWSGK